jgi:hypothetical protein
MFDLGRSSCGNVNTVMRFQSKGKVKAVFEISLFFFTARNVLSREFPHSHCSAVLSKNT